MSEREQPAPDEAKRGPEHLEQRQKDFFETSSPEMQDEIVSRAEEEAWGLYSEAHEASREEALAETRARLHRLSEKGVEITEDIEERELKHAESTLRRKTPKRDSRGRFMKQEEYDFATKSGLDTVAATQDATAAYENASGRTKRRIDRADVRDEIEVKDLAEQLRREETLNNVQNHIDRTSEQGARWWPWEKYLERRKALNELKEKEITEDWLARARKHRQDQIHEFEAQGQPASETMRAVEGSIQRIIKTYKKSNPAKWVVAMPFRLAAELGRLVWHGIKRGRKEARIQMGAAKKRSGENN
ncbi:MAG: hypothetical protein WD603_00160 [Patescibacteria group bacterium]